MDDQRRIALRRAIARAVLRSKKTTRKQPTSPASPVADVTPSTVNVPASGNEVAESTLAAAAVTSAVDVQGVSDDGQQTTSNLPLTVQTEAEFISTTTTTTTTTTVEDSWTPAFRFRRDVNDGNEETEDVITEEEVDQFLSEVVLIGDGDDALGIVVANSKFSNGLFSMFKKLLHYSLWNAADARRSTLPTQNAQM